MPPRPGSASAGRCTAIVARLVELQDRRLVRALGHRGDDLLRDLERVAARARRPVGTRRRIDLPFQALDVDRHRDVPAELARFARRERRRPAPRAAPHARPAAGADRAPIADALRALRRVAHRERRRGSGRLRARAAASRRAASGPASSGSSPRRCRTAGARAGHRDDAKAVSESLSGTSTVALPASSSGTRAFHSSSVSNSSRADCRPPPPPAARPCARNAGARSPASAPSTFRPPRRAASSSRRAASTTCSAAARAGPRRPRPARSSRRRRRAAVGDGARRSSRSPCSRTRYTRVVGVTLTAARARPSRRALRPGPS